jgi:hypothetical protein
MNNYIQGDCMSNEKEIFEGKTFQDLTKDIYENTTKRKTQIDLLISEIHGFITTIDDVVLVAPIIKEYMDTAVRNDEHLVKLAGVLQRIISKSQGESDESMLLSDEEKADLMGTLQDTVDDLQKESQRLENIKDKTVQKGFSES